MFWLHRVFTCDSRQCGKPMIRLGFKFAQKESSNFKSARIPCQPDDT